MSTVSAYTVNRKNAAGKFEKVSKLFANKDGSYGNKKDGYLLKLSGQYPDLEINGQRYGKTFLNTSKASGNSYYIAKDSERGDLFIFAETERKGPSDNRPNFQKRA